jgi:hypothetical protein
MFEFFKNYPFFLGALTGSLAAYILQLFVNHLRREKKWLGYSINSRNIVSRDHSRLSLSFEGKDIQRLDSHTISIRNIGNKPLVNVPIRIECHNDGSIVEHEVKGPDGSKFTALLESQQTLLVTCDLLNPEETAQLGITIADSTSGEIKFIARGESLVVKEISANANTEELLEILAGTSSIMALSINLSKLLLGTSKR